MSVLSERSAPPPCGLQRSCDRQLFKPNLSDLGLDVERQDGARCSSSPHASRGTRHMISNSLPSGSWP